MGRGGYVVVTGGAGFIGSHLVDALAAQGYRVGVVDDLSSGSLGNLAQHAGREYFTFVRGDLRRLDGGWIDVFRGAEAVFHYAANPEVRVSVTEPRLHFEENVVATFNVLEACRLLDIPTLVFASTSTVYGDARVIPTPEDYHPLEPISVYGASKLASENMITAYSKLYGLRALILRYANIIGPRSNHGVIVDFIGKLRENPGRLEILGDGSQRKSYLHIYDAVDATLHLYNHLVEDGWRYKVFNVGSRDWVTVREIADIVVEEMGLSRVEYIYKPATPDGRGWPGDVKQMLLDTGRLESTGWKPRWNSRQAVRRTVQQLLGKQQP